MVKNRFMIFLLAATLLATQGGLVYAANAAPIVASWQTPSPALPEGSGTATACLRGAAPCAGFGSDNCCAEMAAAGAIAGAVQAWLAAGIAAYYYAVYC